ncbi:hypothetical protein M1B74_09630 [Bacteroides pyogenes]|uniref:hypothetical protein n=1 Tax=Bacteroides pyogenes TaxID=310300 RepID=UPI003B42A1A7
MNVKKHTFLILFSKVSHWGNKGFNSGKQKFPQWETDSLHIYASPPPLMVVAGGRIVSVPAIAAI